ncbi:lipopolysaccharide biosynthesis protein [Pontibacter sp. E15-1]|uniref:lipopolysaccharide biosynthesis protein n=1 Tax=Pontibacter sp. E15-1 TaxID=2919918 RepID=UPI001F4FFB3A|nr:lipopolysaccharide biosynthesis protein [Pontibacter sp. E15-1]MCJ8164426.1 lipopolysaccharide biosynthesis protein [Pontibacter sp. E15-1]
MGLQNTKGKIVIGVFWNVLQLVVNKTFSFAIKLVLAKLLFPEQFGLVGMAAVFTSFVQVFNELGIGAALVQRREENLREAHFHTAFWTGVVWSVGIFLLIAFVVAPLAARFYNEPMLRSLIPVLSIGVLSSPINLVHKAQLTKQMDFKKLAFIGNASTIFSGVVALFLAYQGAGVWSLVFNSVASFLIAMPLYFRATKWVPKLIWEKEAFNDIFGFGIYTTGTSVLNNVLANLDYLLIGKLLSASALGIYTFAFVLTDTFRNQFTVMMNKVMYPVYGKHQDDPALLKKYYLKVVTYNSLVIYPFMVLLITLGEPLILNFFGSKWQESIVPMKILALSVMIHMLVSGHSSLLRGQGMPKLEMKLQFFKAIFLYVPLITLGVYSYGIVGVAWACVAYKVLEVILIQYYLKKVVGIFPRDLITHIKAPLIASIVSFGITFLLYREGVHYAVCAVVMILSYGGVVALLMHSELMLQFKELKSGRAKKQVA